MSRPSDTDLIDLLGGTSAVSKLLGVQPPSVSEWRRTGIPDDKLIRMAVPIEEASDGLIRRWHLRPDDWHRIWPELVEAKGAPTPTTEVATLKSKNKPAMSAAERRHVERVKLQPCAVCDTGGGEYAPSEAHEIEQGSWWLCIALCADCHRGSFNGLHGQRRIWAVKKMGELDALAITIRRLVSEGATA